MPNYTLATNLASQILIQQNHITTFPIEPQEIKISNQTNIFCTFQEYAKITKIPIEKLTHNNNFNDGYTLRNIRPNTNLILYNSFVNSSGRIKWTNSHELGHIVLNHLNHSIDNEKEANAFASQLLLPKCILKKLIKENVPITPLYLVQTFGLSDEAARNAIASLRFTFNSENENIYDEALLIKFNSFLVSKTCNFFNSYLDNIEFKRNLW